MKNTVKQLDFKSVLIGVLSSVLVFVLVGAKSTPENLGDIVVDSIRIVDGGSLKIFNNEGRPSGVFETYPNGGALAIFNNKGEARAAFSNLPDGPFIEFYSGNEGKVTARLP